MASPAEHNSERALSIIRRAASRRALSHALILSGGEERFAAARYAAAAMECSAAQKPCLSCAHCRKVLSGIHPDVTFVRDDEHVEIAVDIIRAVRADAFIRPNEGARKVYIFEDCGALNDRDQNVLLKIVEEGPPYASFLFCTPNASSLLQTIRSRCLEIKLPDSPAAAADLSGAVELCRALCSGAAARAACFTKLEGARPSREQLSALFEQTRLLLAEAVLQRYGRAVELGSTEIASGISSRLTKTQILGTIELLETYRNHCEFNVGTGPLLGGLAVELEEIL